MRDAYAKEGYQVLAITDHNHLESHEALGDGHFLLLTAYEVDFNEAEGGGRTGCGANAAT